MPTVPETYHGFICLTQVRVYGAITDPTKLPPPKPIWVRASSIDELSCDLQSGQQLTLIVCGSGDGRCIWVTETIQEILEQL